jgi:hypothetical protein
MGGLKRFAIVMLWFFLCCAIPAALLYPLELWALTHTRMSENAMTDSYIAGIGLLFFPAWLLIDFIYRRIVIWFDRAA